MIASLDRLRQQVPTHLSSCSHRPQRVAPHPDALSQADQPAPQDHFFDKDTLIATAFSSTGASSTAASGETPHLHPTRWASSFSLSSDDDENEEEGVEKKVASLLDGQRRAQQDKLDAGKAWADDYFPAGRREQWIWRGKRMVIECRENADYQASMALDAVSAWARFADGAPYMRKVLLQAGYIIEPACTSRAGDQGHGFYQDTYKGHFDNLFDAAATSVKSIAADPLNKQFGADWARLTRDLLFDGEGNLHFKTTLWRRRAHRDTPRADRPRCVLSPVGYVPIPRVDLLPNIVELKAHNYVRFSPYAAGAGDAARHEVVSVSTFAQIQADMRGVAFYFRTKTGIRMSDVVLGGQGVTATVTLASSAATDPMSVFTVPRVRGTLGALKFSIRDSKHDPFISRARGGGIQGR
ncbi:hypothetical protein FB451DRAFT_1434247 [Mycena latifolia]|nr:hypothetical protein FB451DRAFT_1434247 [Mycena latifolia]